jgi:predicted secreted protein
MWSEGIIADPATGAKYKYWVKHFEEGSEFGIDGGKVSKLTIRKVGESRDVANYDRGWDKEPTEEVMAVYAIILGKYN